MAENKDSLDDHDIIKVVSGFKIQFTNLFGCCKGQMTYLISLFMISNFILILYYHEIYILLVWLFYQFIFLNYSYLYFISLGLSIALFIEINSFDEDLRLLFLYFFNFDQMILVILKILNYLSKIILHFKN